MVRVIFTVLLGALIGCSASPEPLALPDDATQTGVPVGVQTHTVGGLTVEVWYPAAEIHRGDASASIDIGSYLPDSVKEVLGTPELPPITTIAVRDAAVRVPETPYPVVLFSHGFGGVRVQSNDITTHLASRGYIVAATEHSGRSIYDLLPCMFSPPLEGCNLSGMGGEDSGPGDMQSIVGWLQAENENVDSVFYETMDIDALGVMGHSAGGGSTAALVDIDTRFKAAIPMGGTGPISRDVPTLVMEGSCDAIVESESIRAQYTAMPNAALATFRGAGHLAFSDLCDLDFGRFGEELLLPRDDINAFFVESLIELGTDGCPQKELVTPPNEDCAAGYMDLETSKMGIRQLMTEFFDGALLGTDPYAMTATDPSIEVITP